MPVGWGRLPLSIALSAGRHLGVVARWISSSVKSTDNPERIDYETICAIYVDNYDEGGRVALARIHVRGQFALGAADR
jgi:hypothetical protein